MAETFVTVYQGNGGRVDLGYDYTQDVNTNKTTLTVKAYVVKTNSTYYSYRNSPQTFTLTVNGVSTTYGWTFNFSNMSLNARYLITSAVREISHNADGTKSAVSASVYCATGTDGLGTISGNTSIAIATIPRASVPTSPDTNQPIGSVITINTNRASTSFTHTVTYSFGSASGTIGTGVGDSVAWTLPTSLASKIPNDTSGVGTITVKTYSGSTLIGTKTLSFTATIPDTAAYKPTASVPTKAIYGSGRDKTISKYVQGISKVTTGFTATAQGGATIKSSSISIVGPSGGNPMSISGTSGTSGILTLAGTYTIKASTTDSRGKTTTSSTTFVVEAYSVPKITSYTAVRNATTKTTVNNNAVGTYTYMAGSNPLTVVIAKKLITDTSFTNLNTTSGTTSGTFSNTFASTGNTETVSYHFRVTITDSFGNDAVALITVSTSSVALSIKADIGIGVGKTWERGALDVGGNAFVTGVLQPSGGVMSPFGVLGGTFGAGRPTTANLIPVGDTSMKHMLATSAMTDGYPGYDGYITHFEWDTTAGWSSQMFISNNTVPVLKYRGLSPGGWGLWKSILTEDNQYSVPINVDHSRMASLASEVRISLPVNVGEGAIWMVVVRANQNPGGSTYYKTNFVGILSATGRYDGSNVVLDPEWTSISAHQGMGTLTVTPYAIVSGKGYVTTAIAGSEANNSPLGLIVSGFSTNLPTLTARDMVVTIKRLY